MGSEGTPPAPATEAESTPPAPPTSSYVISGKVTYSLFASGSICDECGYNYSSNVVVRVYVKYLD